MAAQPLIISGTKLPAYSDELVGVEAAQLKQLVSWHIPLVPTMVLSDAWFQTLVDTSPSKTQVMGWLQKLTTPSQESPQTQKKLVAEMERMSVQHELKHTLFHWYHEYLGGQYVSVRSTSYADCRHDQVHGNVNLLESSIQVWVQSLLRADKNSRTTQLHNKAVIVSAQPTATYSALLHTHHPDQLTKASIRVSFWHGELPPAPDTPHEEIELDTRSNMIIRRQVATQHEVPVWRSRPDGLEVTQQKQSPIALTSEVIEAISDLGGRLRQHSLKPTCLQLVLTGTRILACQLRPEFLPQDQVAGAIHKSASATPVLLHVSSKTQVTRSLSLSDGVGIIDLTSFFTATGNHPLYSINTANFAAALDSQLTQLLTTAGTHTRSHTPLLLKTQDIPSDTLQTLQHAQSYLLDTSPTTSQRGSQLDLEHPALLRFQLERFVTLLSTTAHPLGLLMSRPSSPLAWSQLLRAVSATKGLTLSRAQLYFEVASPATAKQLRLFNLDEVKGVVLNVQSLLELSTGNSLSQVLQLSTNFLAAELANLIQTTRSELKTAQPTRTLPISADFSFFSPELVTLAIQLGCATVLCLPTDVASVRSVLHEHESQTWKRSRHR